MYDTIIIGAGMSGLAAGVRLAYFQRRGLHPRAARRDRRAEFVLRPPRTDVERRPARGDQLRRRGGTRRRPGAAAAAIAPGLGRVVAVAADRIGDHVPRAEHRVFQRHRPAGIGDRTAFPAAARQLLAAAGGLDRLRSVDKPEAGRSARKVVGDLIDNPLLVEMLFCPVLFYGRARERDMDFGQFSIMFRSIFLRGAGPAAGRRAADPEAAGGQVPRAGRRNVQHPHAERGARSGAALAYR